MPIESLEDLLALPLFAFYERLQRSPLDQREDVLESFSKWFKEHKDDYRDSDPDTLHNLVMDAARLRRLDLELALLETGIELFPDNADIRADMLQVLHLKMFAPDRAAHVWEEFNDDQIVPRDRRERNWRYWVFGAIYFARGLEDEKTARELMMKGLDAVPGSSKANVLRSLDDVFIDHAIKPDFDTVISKLKEGIRLKYPLGYTLAQKLAEILQQSAGIETKQENKHKKLREALHWLDVAEERFTNDGNHPVTEIYRIRINVLMGLGHYAEAMDYIAAYAKQDPQKALYDRSLRAQLELACRRSGQPEEAEKILQKQEESTQLMDILQRMQGDSSKGTSDERSSKTYKKEAINV